jgi:hypothetical protein
LQASSQNWHEGQHSLISWWEYFVGVMLVKAYREFEDRVGATGKVHVVAVLKRPAGFGERLIDARASSGLRRV